MAAICLCLNVLMCYLLEIQEYFEDLNQDC